MFGAAMLKASAGEARTQSGQTHLHRIPKGDSWVHLLSQIREGKLFVAKNGSFLEKEFLSKELSGRKIELDEVVEPLLQPESDATQKDVFCGAYVC